MKTAIGTWLMVDFNPEKLYLEFSDSQYVIRDIS